MKNPIMIVGAKMALPTSNWVSLVEHALLVAVAASLTYLSENIGNEDFGIYTPMVVALVSLVMAYVTKVINNPVVPPMPPVPNPVVPTPDNNTNDDHDFPIG